MSAIGVIDKVLFDDSNGSIPNQLTEPFGSVLESLDDVMGAGESSSGTGTPSSGPATAAPVGTQDVITTLPNTTSTPVATTTSPAPTSTVSETTLPASEGVLLLDALAFVAVTNEHRGGYNRDLFDDSIDHGGGCTTRDLVLSRDSLTPVQRDQFDCDVTAGDWFSVYDGLTLTEVADVQVDHVVALKEAWDSGAWAWSPEQRRAFANDLSDQRTLRAVSGAANQGKSASDPANWMPPEQGYWCAYLGDWVAIKLRWGLSMDQSEFGRIRNLVRDRCQGWRIDPVEPLPDFALVAPAVAIQPIAPLPLVPPGVLDVAVYFENCDDARAAGAAPVRRGDPGYRPALDRNNDGVGCE